MGQGTSQPERHLFQPETPVRFSQAVLDGLQASPESDSTRAQIKELHQQERRNAELKQQRDNQAKRLEQLTSSLTTDAPAEETTSSTPSVAIESVPSAGRGLAYHLSSPFYQDHSSPSTPAAATTPIPEPSNRSHDSVMSEVQALRQKLEARKGVQKMSPEVEKAKEGLVQCLRTNDRRPLDCWQEVEDFKREVGRLEKAFVDRAGR
ncbi:hypothetical protein MBLNU230_g7514t1 [Neophaeotheca triangularis]